MRKNKILYILLALCLIALVMAVTGCGGTENEPPAPEKVDYTVKVTDPSGAKLSTGVYIEFFKDGTSIGTKALNKNGEVVFNLEKGNYTFNIATSKGEYYYDKDKCAFGDNEFTSEIVMYNMASDNVAEIFVPSENGESEGYNAKGIGDGVTYLPIDRALMTYAIFTPTRGGIYRFSCSQDAQIGYYGGSIHYISATNSAIMNEDGSFDIEVPDSGIGTSNTGTTIIILGVTAEGKDSTFVTVERIADPTPVVEWKDIQIDKNAAKHELDSTTKFTQINIKDKSLTVVLNENDGFYHLNTKDGPLVYIKLDFDSNEEAAFKEGETVEAFKYLPALLKMGETTALGKVFYDEDGNIVKKEAYNTMLEAYDALTGGSHMYPLNEQLASAVKNIGDYMGWFNFDAEMSIFGQDLASINKDNAWLLFCYYVG